MLSQICVTESKRQTQRLSPQHYQQCCGHDLSQQQRGLDPDYLSST